MDILRACFIYKVISYASMDGIRIDHFDRLEDASEFARNATNAGFDCLVCKVVQP